MVYNIGFPSIRHATLSFKISFLKEKDSKNLILDYNVSPVF